MVHSLIHHALARGRSAWRTMAIAVCVVLVGQGAGPALGAPVGVGIRTFTDLTVDEAHGSIYITSGGQSSAITVLNLDGSPKTLIEGVVGAEDIALSHDGAALYVAIRDQRAIGTIDAATHTITKRTLGSGICPTSLAQVGTTLWFSYEECQSPWRTALGSLELDSGSVTLRIASLRELSRLFSSPSVAGRLFVRRTDALELLDVSSGAVQAPTQIAVAMGTFGNLGFTPDGTEVVSGGALSTSDLTPSTSYGSAYPTSVSTAIRSDGLIAIGSGALTLYERRNPTPWRQYRTAAFGTSLFVVGLSFGARDLYTVFLRQNYVDPVQYRIARVTPRRASSLVLTTPAAGVDSGVTASVTAHLVGGSTNRTVSIFAQPVGQARVLLVRGLVNANGDLSASVRPLRRTTIVAVYDGDEAYDGSTASRMLPVRARVMARISGGVGQTDGRTLLRMGSRPVVIATVAPNHAGECVRIARQVFLGGKWWPSSAPCITLDRYSRARLTIPTTEPQVRLMRVRAMWKATTINDAGTSAWVGLKLVP